MLHRRYTAVRAPFGLLYLTLDGDRLVRIDPRRPTVADALRFDDHPLLSEAAAVLRDYFEGHLQQPSLRCNDTFSPFQAAVSEAVKAIPYGEARTVEAIAAAIGRPGSTHAIEVLCRCNPLWIAVPTHRVLTTERESTPHLSPQELLRRMEQRYAHDRLTKRTKEGKLF